MSLPSIQTVGIEMRHRAVLYLLGGLELVMLIKQLASDSEFTQVRQSLGDSKIIEMITWKKSGMLP